MKQFAKHRLLILISIGVFVLVGLGWLSYFLWGHQIVADIYNSPSAELLHKLLLMDGQRILPLAHYFRGTEALLWSATLAAVILCCAATWFVAIPPRITIAVLTPLFIVVSLLAATIAFVYPLEIETRESTVWLHVLALKHGINIYDHAQVAFINQNHGPLDSLFKVFVATLLPFLEPWQVARFSVFVLPCAFLLVAWKYSTEFKQTSRRDALYLGAIGYLFLVLSAKEFIFVGRSDATAALLLLPLTYLSVSVPSAAFRNGILYGLVAGSLGMLVVLTNWRMVPVIGALLAFNLWRIRHQGSSRIRFLPKYISGYLGAATAIFALVLIYSFDADFPRYYKHFFGIYTKASGHGHSTYEHASFLWFLGSLLRPTASPDSLKGSPLLWAVAVYLLTMNKLSAENRAWFLLGSVVFASCTAAYYLNYYGGGQWYYMPFVIILWFFLCTHFPHLSEPRAAAMGIMTVGLLGLNIQTVIAPTSWRVATFSQAHDFMADLRSLQRQHSVLSEDTYFYRTSYGGELIDMGDMVSRIRKKGYYYGDQFNRTVDRHFERLRKDPPEYIVTGVTESPELRRLIEEDYILVARGPENFTANGLGESQLFRRKTLPAPEQTAHSSGIAARSPTP